MWCTCKVTFKTFWLAMDFHHRCVLFLVQNSPSCTGLLWINGIWMQEQGTAHEREVMYLHWALKMTAERENSPCNSNGRHMILLGVLLHLECKSIPCHFLHPIYLISAISLGEPTACKVKLHLSVYNAFFFSCKRKQTAGNVRDFTLEKHYCVRHDMEK